MNRVGVIGVGLVTAGGNSLSATWAHLLAGKVGRLVQGVEGKPRLFDMAMAAIRQFWTGMPVDALVVGSTSASFSEVEKGGELDPGYLAAMLAKELNIPESFQVSQACASSSHAIAMGVDLIREGGANVVLAGGVDEVTDCVVEAFRAVGILAAECKPFDKDRKGLVLSEAAAFVLLAKEGIGKPVCYVDGVGLGCDAWDSVGMTEEGVARTIMEAVCDADVNRGRDGFGIDFIIAHGTGTKMNDLVEAEAIHATMEGFGLITPMVSSYKGSLGHPQGASGAVGIVLGVKALAEQTIFPTVGLVNFDPDITVPTTTTKRYTTMERVMVLSYGSWGTNAAIVLSRVKK